MLVVMEGQAFVYEVCGKLDSWEQKQNVWTET